MRYLTWMVLLGVVAFASTGRAATPDQVEKAMVKAKEWLFKEQKNGHWEKVTVPDLKAWGNVTEGPQFTGRTAFSTFALLCAGVPEKDPRIVSAIEFLRKNPTRGTYALASRCLVWSSIKLDPETKNVASKDLSHLLSSMRQFGPARGMYYYLPPVDKNDVIYDHSVSQFAVLAVWSMERRGFEVPSNFWNLSDQAWRAHQMPDGGWNYMLQDRDPQTMIITPTMSSAGTATVMLTRQASQRSSRCEPQPVDQNVKRGLDWLANNFQKVFDPGAEAFRGGYATYSLFSISRIGTAAGLTMIGPVDWYKEGCDFLIKTQQPDGSWSGGWLINGLPSTSMGLLFLAYGSAPVIVNKLQYTTRLPDGKEIETWNLRSQDLFNFSRWMSSEVERRLNWQVVNLNSKSTTNLDAAPILFIGGNKPLNFSPADVDALRKFVERGGMIVGNSDCSSKEFTASFLKLGTTLFPRYEFRMLPDNHPIYTRQLYNAGKWKAKPNVQAMTNGVREIMLLPEIDLSKPLHQNDSNFQKEPFMLLCNVALYATDRTGLQQRGVSHIVEPDPAVKPARSIKLARLKHAGNWDPEPGGWRRLSAILHNKNNLALGVDVVELGNDRLKEFKLAHFTGTEGFKLTDVQRNELKAFVDGGGTLMIDAGGGSMEFAASVEKELAQTFGDDMAAELKEPLPIDHAVYSIPSAVIKDVQYRNFFRERGRGALKVPSLRAIKVKDRPAVFYSREDLSGGLVGQAVDGIAGYEPESSTAIMRNLILFAAK